MGKSKRVNHQVIAQRQRNGNVLMAQKSEFFSGPLPHPEQLAQYEQTCPGAADRILCMAEQQSMHRRELEKKVVDSKISDSKRGQIFGFSIGALAIIGGIVLLLNKINIAGYVALFAPLTALVGVYLYGRKKAQDEREKKLENKP